MIKIKTKKNFVYNSLYVLKEIGNNLVQDGT